MSIALLVPGLSVLHDFGLHLEERFISEAQSQPPASDFLALKCGSLQWTDHFAFWTDHIGDICDAAELQRAAKTANIGIEVLGDGLVCFLSSPQWRLHTRSNLDHGILFWNIRTRCSAIAWSRSAVIEDDLHVLGRHGMVTTFRTFRTRPLLLALSRVGKGSTRTSIAVRRSLMIQGRFSGNASPSSWGTARADRRTDGSARGEATVMVRVLE